MLRVKSGANFGFRVYFGIFLAFLLTFLTVSPINAAILEESTDTDVELNINSAIAITTPDELLIDVTPSIHGEFAYETANINVSTNNRTGYTLTMSAKTTDITLVSDKSTGEITNLTSDVSISSSLDHSAFPKDQWGYTATNNLDSEEDDTSTTFSPIPAPSSPSTIAVTDAKSNNSITPVTFGVKVSTDIDPGIYKNTVVFSAVTNFVPNYAFDDAFYLQDMTPEICAKETTPDKTATVTTRESLPGDTTKIPEAELVDSRDGEKYLIRKLADGNCWMVQNLRLKLAKSVPLTSEDTDVTSNFTPTYATQPTATKTTSWGSYNTASNVNTSRSYDVGGDYGVLYNWYTATAGSGLYNNTTATTPVNSSICPKNWRLPVGYSQDVDKSFVHLFAIYDNSAGNPSPFRSAFNLQLPGAYNYSGSFSSLDSSGGLWSASPHTSINYASRMLVGDTSVTAHYTNYKANGYSVRCLAR